MQIPIPIVIFLIILVVGGTWWKNTRHLDFMTPPPAERLERVKLQARASLPRADERIEEPPPKPVKVELPPAPIEPPKPEVDLGDLSAPPTLMDYGLRAPEGIGSMIELAKALEEKGHFQRALIAWERVLDMTKPDPEQTALAISAVKRLRPTLPDWNSTPGKAIAVTIHAGTGKKLAKDLTPILKSVAADLERASSGILKIEPLVSAGKTTAKGVTPVALWLAGPEKKSTSTEVMSFTVDQSSKLRDEVMKSVFQLLRNHLANTTAYTPPAELGNGESVEDALNFRVTRLSWSEFGSSMNLPAKKAK